jgi:hypothetical protein
MSYALVASENFTLEHKNYLEAVKGYFRSDFHPPKFISGVKDIDSKHIISTDVFAMMAGLSCGEDVADRFDCDMPCKAAELAQDFVDEDRELLRHGDAYRKHSLLNINQYSTGIKALITEKYPLKHTPSRSILGIMFLSTEVDISQIFTFMPDYMLEFGVNGNIQNISGPLKIGNIRLTDYEHEVAFLMTMNWSFKHITDFINKYRPTATPRLTDTIYKCRDRVCLKLDCEAYNIRDKLIELGIHKKMPSSLFKILIGNKVLS